MTLRLWNLSRGIAQGVCSMQESHRCFSPSPFQYQNQALHRCAMSPTAASSGPISLYLDFDSTLTETDTLSALSALAPAHRASHLPALPPFSHFTDAYLSDLEAHQTRTISNGVDDPLDAEIARLEALRPIEDASLTRLEQVGWFQGLTAKHVAGGATAAVEKGDVQLRRGWADLMGSVQRSGGDVAVVSVNWSRAWVGGCLRAAKSRVSLDEGVNLDDVEIVSNELEGVEDGTSGASGRILAPASTGLGRIMASGDKRAALDALMARDAPNASSENGKRIYVGDSMTDLECLLAVDVGIVIRNDEVSMTSGQKDLAERLERVGASVRWVGEYAEETTGDSDRGRIVWWARDFEEIMHAVISRDLT